MFHASNADDPYLARGPDGDGNDDDDDDDEIDDFRVRPDDNLLVVGQTEDVYSHLSVNGELFFLSPLVRRFGIGMALVRPSSVRLGTANPRLEL